jgi:hypothetical protein
MRLWPAICKDGAQIDPRSDAYRYPIDTKGHPSTKQHQVVNLRSLATRMAAVLEDLDTVHFGLDIETYQAQELYEIWSSSFRPAMLINSLQANSRLLTDACASALRASFSAAKPGR